MHHLSTPCTRWVTGALYPLRVKSVLGKAFCFAFRSLLSNALSDSAFSSSSYLCLARCSSLAYRYYISGQVFMSCASHRPLSAGHFPEQCGVRRRGIHESVSLCDPLCQWPLASDIPEEQIPAGAAQSCPPALILVCAAHELTLLWHGWAEEPHLPACEVGNACAVSSMRRSPCEALRLLHLPHPGSCSLSFAFPSAGPTAVAAEPQTQSPGHLSAETMTPAHGPRSPTAVGPGAPPCSGYKLCPCLGSPQCCPDFTPAVPGSSPLVLHSEQMLESLIEALAPAEDSASTEAFCSYSNLPLALLVLSLLQLAMHL